LYILCVSIDEGYNTLNALTQNAKRLTILDLLRGSAIIGVLAIHVSGAFTRIDGVTSLVGINVVINTFTHYAVPLFVILSGILLAMRYYQGFSLKRFYSRRFLTIVPPYIIFTIGYQLLKTGWSDPASFIRTLIENLCTGSGYYHLWFFPMIIFLYALYPLFEKLYRYCEIHKKELYLLGGLLVLQIAWDSLVLHEHSSGGSYLFDSLLRRTVLSYIFYFVVGMYIGRNWKVVIEKMKKLSNIYIQIVAYGLTMILSLHWLRGILEARAEPSYFIIARLVEPFLYLATVILLTKALLYIQRSHPIITRIMYCLGSLSFGIYLVHVFVIRFFDPLLERIGMTPEDYLYYPVLFVVVLAVSYFFVHVINYLPFSKYIVGHARSKRR